MRLFTFLIFVCYAVGSSGMNIIIVHGTSLSPPLGLGSYVLLSNSENEVIVCVHYNL